MYEKFRQVPIFAELRDDDLAEICSKARDVSLIPGEVLFHEGEAGDRAFVIASGTLEILRSTERREVLVAVRGAGEVIGEMALLDEQPRAATARARAAAELVSIPREALEHLLATSPSAARSILGPLARRVRETNDLLKHQERMALLGVMTAGVAHELNNPSSAAQRAAGQLVVQVADLVSLIAGQGGSGVVDLLTELSEREPAVRTPVETSDLEEALENWLAEHGVGEGWRLAPILVEAGVVEPDLDSLLLSVRDPSVAVGVLAAAAAVRQSAAVVAGATRRLSEIVRVMSSHSYLDQAPLQEVDVVRGIEDTLMLLSHATGGLRVVREYDADLPSITAMGGELNQVWTNLIHNACDALADVVEPTLTVRVRRAGDGVVVEVEDNGAGIPAEAQERVFDAFYTTKPPGQGTGLGLQVSYGIVVEHGGDLTLTSAPGLTTFRVSLPLRPPTLERSAQDGRNAMDSAPCEHLAGIESSEKRPGGCADCLAVGDTWVHLRSCASCGKIGCCNDSRNKHAARHAASSGHPVILSNEPGEYWAWCFVDDVGVPLAPLGD